MVTEQSLDLSSAAVHTVTAAFFRNGCSLWYAFTKANSVAPMPTDQHPTDNPITQLLKLWQQGDHNALEKLSPLVYQELHRLASYAMRGERPDHTLQPTALVNEALLKLLGSKVCWQDRSHFYTVAARQMRRILVDHARSRQRKKRGQGQRPLTLDESRVSAKNDPSDLIELDDSLSKLAMFDQRKHDIVELHYFAGLSMEETAAVLDISSKTVQRELRLAEAWLYNALEPHHDVD